jgi:phage terminase large subunit-like protein
MTSLLVYFEIASDDEQNSSIGGIRTWQRAIEALHTSGLTRREQTSGATSEHPEVYGRDSESQKSVLLILRGYRRRYIHLRTTDVRTADDRSEDEVREVLTPFTDNLRAPVIVYTVPTANVISRPGVDVQETILYRPLDENFKSLRMLLEMQYDKWQHRCIVRELAQGELPGEHEWQGEKCKAWAVWTVWFEGSHPLPPDGGGHEGDEEIMKSKSMKLQGAPNAPTLGCVERNCKSVRLRCCEDTDTITGHLQSVDTLLPKQETERKCIVM